MAVAPRCPQRLDRASSISFSISRSVRYSRGRPGLTVTFTDVGGRGIRCGFSTEMHHLHYLDCVNTLSKCNSTQPYRRFYFRSLQQGPTFYAYASVSKIKDLWRWPY